MFWLEIYSLENELIYLQKFITFRKTLCDLNFFLNWIWLSLKLLPEVEFINEELVADNLPVQVHLYYFKLNIFI